MLDPKLREEAFRLRNEENMTFSEISRRLGVPGSTIRTWFYRAQATPDGDDSQESRTERFAKKSKSISNSFTEETQALLASNPYVRFVSKNQIRFTQSFREEYWKRYRNGQETKDILSVMGIAPEILGESRIIGLHKRIAEAAANGRLSIGVENAPSNLFADGVVPAKAIAQMRHELAYLRQEIDFIKKIMSLGEEKKS